MVLFSILLTLLLEWMGAFTRLELSSFDHRAQLFRFDKKLHEDVVVLLIDEQSLQQMQQRFGRWPWPRSAYGDLLEFFTRAKVQSVAFDILFSEQQAADHTARTDDENLVKATRKAANVVHSMQLTKTQGNKSQRELPDDFIKQHQIDNVKYSGKSYDNYLIPFDQLYKAANAVGNIEIEPDSDGIYRRLRLFNQYQRFVFPAISTALVLPLIMGEGEIMVKHDTVDIAGFHIPLLEDGRYLVNSVGQMNMISALDVFKTMDQIHTGKSESLILNPEDYTNKIILIGASAIGLLDVKSTAMSSAEPGVFLHASTVSNILEQDFLQKSDVLTNTLILILAAIVSSVPIIFLGRLWLAAILPISFGLVYMASAYFAFSSNLILPVINVLFVIASAMFMSLYFRVSAEKKHKQKVRTMLSQYVSPNVMSVVLDQYDELVASDGKNENLSILFSDIRSFTNISEKFKATEVVEMLNIYFSEMTDIIFEKQGTLNKFIGDAILAFWGAPIKTDLHADQALSAALLMRENLPKVNHVLQQKGFSAIDVGIGIHTGDVVLGNIGSHKRLDYTIIGDAVNLASRVEGLTKVYGVSILLTEDTYKALQNTVKCIKVDKVTVKGKQQPVLLYTPAMNFISENNLSISPDELLLINSDAFNFYQQQQWQLAKQSLESVGKSKLFDIFIERCNFYLTQEPGSNWNGIYEHISK